MKLTVEWLREYVDTDASADEIGAVLTMLGLELEALEDSPLGPVLDFKVTPNRGDCLSVLGIARELCAKDCGRFRPSSHMQRMVGPAGGAAHAAPTGEKALVEILDADLCARYGARLFRGVKVGTASEKVRQRLQACGMRPINVVVDTTNYVTLELGQPLHAFDQNRLQEGRIVVRRAAVGETLTTLDGAERALGPEMLMICDAKRPVAVAGVMGGEDSEVRDDTTNLLLESAHFDPISIRRTRNALGLNTEASYRFERYVDPEGVVRALNRFADLMKEQTGGDALPGVFDAYPRPWQPRKTCVRELRWNRLLGADVPVAAAATGLQALGCTVAERDGTLEVTPPSWRQDLVEEDDLIEEIGRLWGYEKIPEALPTGSTTLGGESPEAAFRTDVREAMLRLGFTEIATHTLCDGSPLDSECERIRLRNPAAPELALLRCSLLPGLAEAAARNRGRPLFLFEAGRVFRDCRELSSLAFLMSGRLLPAHWVHKESPSADLFAAKGAIEELFALLRRRARFSPSCDKRFHPARQASVGAGGTAVGAFGEVATEVATAVDLPPETVLAELDLSLLFTVPEAPPLYAPISPYPAVRRDLAMSVQKDVPYGDLERAVREAAAELLESVWLFDVYEGPGIESGRHSIGIAMLLRHPGRTLTDEEANEVRERAWAALEQLGAQRR